ncbi:hypothetical protein ZYGR_0AZ02640 [Zygosaccharomyces rouxii]|uniref:Replication termination factor 2 n=1 Tax=Zygosaccharomyces rouxii TaxID=4956 RepID=A0A1Q3AKJ5_ZYGRO|nr:hypothetical protein ZYGR_0AZ02640 [Zygosaccharomyces rouxii]
MGNDGGTINKVHRLQLAAETDRSKSPAEQELRQFQDASIWTCCRLTNKRLRLPLVSDFKGNLLNKESVLEWLLTPEREDFNQEQIRQFSHIKKLNDVIDLKGIRETKDGFQCEFSGDELGKTNVKFIYLTNCGDVLPKSSLELSTKKKHCPKCESPYEDLDVITLNPSSYELESLQQRMHKLEELNLHHNGKTRSKKRKKRTTSTKQGNIKRPKNSSET